MISTLKLPDKNNQPFLQKVDSNSIIIIGANGAGKSKLGAWIEQNNAENVHRIGAQRNLNFSEFIPLKSYEQATNALIYGNETEKNRGYRWNWGHLTTTMLNDYENVLAALIALDKNQKDEFFYLCRENEKQGKNHPQTPTTAIDDLLLVWNSVFPQRAIRIIDSKVVATLKKINVDGNIEPESYMGNEMSDGERVALYLIAQCLSIPRDNILIIDEPELHLHRSIMNRLWSELEKKRPDCLFVYITHDTEFAARHSHSKKIWVKSFDGRNWDWEEIVSSNMPEQLLLDIMGNRKKVIFVEGTSESFDTKLYSEIYKDYYVVSCGGCSSVIARVKAMRATPQLHDLECYGIIDRDYRSDAEITAYKEHNIFTLQVAEVENLFLVEELLYEVSNVLAITNASAIEKLKHYIIDDRFASEINRQICEAVVSEVKYQLSIVELSKKSEIEAKQTLKAAFETISYEMIKQPIEDRFNETLQNKNYAEVLKIFNRKELVNSVGRFFGLQNSEFCNHVIRLIQSEHASKIIRAVTPYLPPEIPISY